MIRNLILARRRCRAPRRPRRRRRGRSGTARRSERKPPSPATSCASAIWSRMPASSPRCRSSARPISAPPASVSADAVAEAVRAHALIGLDTGGLSEVVVTRASRDRSPPRTSRTASRRRCRRNTRSAPPRTSRSLSTATCARCNVEADRHRRAARRRTSTTTSRSGRFDVDARRADQRHHARHVAAFRPRGGDRRRS